MRISALRVRYSWVTLGILLSDWKNRRRMKQFGALQTLHLDMKHFLQIKTAKYNLGKYEPCFWVGGDAFPSRTALFV